MSAPAFALIVLIVLAAVVLTVYLIYSRRYQRASQETTFVRTGFGGQKVVMSGGALVFPVLHEIIQVNMNTLRLDIARTQHQALITRDRLRMDVQAEFYVRVQPTLEGIATAAQTLGRRTMNPDALKNLVEGKFVNALRSVAAEMDMDELHQNRGEFVQRVQAAVGEGLAGNGLVLESISLSELDQTDRKYFNPQNAFDAQGLTLLTEMIQARAKQRNAIERDTEVAIRKKNLEAERQTLELSREEEFARLEQQHAIEVRRAEQQTNIIREQVDKERQAREAEFAAKEQMELKQLAVERSLEEERIDKERSLKEKAIASQREVELAEIERDLKSNNSRIAAEEQIERARIAIARGLEEERIVKEQTVKEKEIVSARVLENAAIEKERALREAQLAVDQQLDQIRLAAERAVEAERIEKDLALKQQEVARNVAIEQAETDRRRAQELADLERQIALAAKMQEFTAAQAAVDAARAAAVKAEEQVVTARHLEVAEREKALEIIEALKQAERDAIAVKEAAAAKLAVAAKQAETVHLIASGEAGKIKTIASAEAEAEIIKSDASEKRYRVEAEGQRLLHEAENLLHPDKSAARIKLSIVRHLAEIIGASVKPIESIDGIKIVQVEGLLPHAHGGAVAGEGAAGGNLAEQLVNSALRYRGQAPLVDAILKEVGIAGGDIQGLTAALRPEPEELPPTRGES